MAERFYILTTLLPECLTLLETESVFRSLRSPQPDSGAFLQDLHQGHVQPEEIRFAFLDRVPSSATCWTITSLWGMDRLEENPVDPFWKEGFPNYQLRLRRLHTFEQPLPFRQGADLWELLSATRGRKTSAFYNGGRMLLPLDFEDYALIENFVVDGTTQPVGDELPAPVANSFHILEKHMQAFLAERLDLIEPGLVPYEVGDFLEVRTTDGGRIDILARDVNSVPVVVELKAGPAGDEAIGQLARYMGWAKKTLAAGGPVRGILVASVVSQRLRYAALAIPNVSLVEYVLSFDLRSVEALS